MDQHISLSTVAARLRLAPRELVRMSREGSFIEVYTFGRKRRVKVDDLEKWLASRTERAIAEREEVADQLIRHGKVSVPGYELP